MALTISNIGDDFTVFGNVPVVFKNLTFDAAYPTGGYAVNGGQFGGASTGGGQAANNGIRGLVFVGNNTAAAGYVVQYNVQTGKIQVFVMPGVATAGPLVEVTNNTDLHTLTVAVLAYLAGE